MTATPKITAHNDLAYQRWNAQVGSDGANNWTKQDFWDQLSAAERVAVFTSNLIGQVMNGGFVQWYENGYATPETQGFLTRLCMRLGTEAAAIRMQELLEEFEVLRAEFETSSRGNHRMSAEGEDYAYDIFYQGCDKLDTIVYDLDDQFLAAVENSL